MATPSAQEEGTRDDALAPGAGEVSPDARDGVDDARVDERLRVLMRSRALIEGDLATALTELSEHACELLGCERASVFQLAADGARLECIEQHARGSGEHARGATLEVAGLARFLEQLRHARTLALPDLAAPDGCGSELRGRLVPAETAALLAAPVLVRGRLVGLVAAEFGAVRAFGVADELIAGTLSDFVSLVLTAREQQRVEGQLRSLQARIDDILELRTSQVVRENADLQREVDALQMAAQAIRKSEDDLRRLFAASPVAMLLVRRSDQRVLLANDVSAVSLRAALDDLRDRHVGELFVHRSDLVDLLDALERGGGQEAREVQLRTQTGEPFWALLSSRSVVFGSVDTVIVGFTDLTPQKAVEHQLRYLAQRDPLTQAYNRHHFWQLASSEMARVKRYRRPLSVAMIDADHFKSVNDIYGHDVGDLVLRFIVDTCRESLRQNDVLARYGGEEFVVLLPETSIGGAQAVFERLRERLAQTPLLLADGRSVSITVSIGLAGLTDYDEGFEELLKRADDALYVAKRSGRNCVKVG